MISPSLSLFLQQGFVKHAVNKYTFSEQCYYVFGDFKKAAANNLSTGTTAGVYDEEEWRE